MASIQCKECGHWISKKNCRTVGIWSCKGCKEAAEKFKNLPREAQDCSIGIIVEKKGPLHRPAINALCILKERITAGIEPVIAAGKERKTR